MKRLPQRARIGAILFGALLGIAAFSLPQRQLVAQLPEIAQGPGAPVVVELFTSQGCSSCPPADALLGELADHPGVIALSLHIDYWDYIGWKDPFANAALTARQRHYARRMGLRYVYTPQMVVDGTTDVAGLRRSQVVKAVEKAAKQRKAVKVRFEPADGGKIVVPAGHAPEGGAAVWLAIYDSEHETAVARGENAGRKIKNYRVVRELVQIGSWHGEALEIPFDMAAAAAQGRDGCAVIVQQGLTGPILGAANMVLADQAGQ